MSLTFNPFTGNLDFVGEPEGTYVEGVIELTNVQNGQTLVYNSGVARFQNKDLLDSNVATSGTSITLTATSPTYQFINPTASIDVNLPTVTGYKGFVIKNTGTTNNGITVKTQTGTLISPVIGNGYSMTVIWNGVNWEVL